MRMTTPFVGLLVALAGCQGPEPILYSFDGAVIACETLEWARERAELVKADGTGEVERFSSTRCFSVESNRPVTIVQQPAGGFLRGPNRWVRVATLDGEPLEHYASAQLRLATGQTPRSEGWVRRSDVLERS